jgi:hypothetical protein
MKKLFIFLFTILLIAIATDATAQNSDPAGRNKAPSFFKQIFTKKSSGKPQVKKKEKKPFAGLFRKKESAKVPPGYAYDNRETTPKKITDTPNSKQLLPKDQQKRMAAKKKNKKLFKK